MNQREALRVINLGDGGEVGFCVRLLSHLFGPTVLLLFELLLSRGERRLRSILSFFALP